jgi:hypothetical protein
MTQGSAQTARSLRECRAHFQCRAREIASGIESPAAQQAAFVPILQIEFEIHVVMDVRGQPFVTHYCWNSAAVPGHASVCCLPKQMLAVSTSRKRRSLKASVRLEYGDPAVHRRAEHTWAPAPPRGHRATDDLATGIADPRPGPEFDAHQVLPLRSGIPVPARACCKSSSSRGRRHPPSRSAVRHPRGSGAAACPIPAGLLTRRSVQRC